MGEFLKGKVTLITGGTGSFGHAAAKRFIIEGAKEVRILSRDEKKQDDMRREFDDPALKFYIGDVRDLRSIEYAFYGVDYVFSAAALKQVPSCEFFPLEATKTNVIGSDNVITACLRAHVKAAVFLSTDKAAYPINAMGITKALMEKNVIARSRDIGDRGTTLCLTRYGNVMGSRGSVIPLFLSQIEQGKPLTVTNPDMTRFMMTLNQAIDLVLFALENGSQGDLFVLKAPSSTVGDLANAVKQLKGSDLPIHIIGTRHGEKKFETLVTAEEMARAIDMGNYYRIPSDNRDLNYDRYFVEGEKKIEEAKPFDSSSCPRLDIEQTKRLLSTLKLFGGTEE